MHAPSSHQPLPHPGSHRPRPPALSTPANPRQAAGRPTVPGRCTPSACPPPGPKRHQKACKRPEREGGKGWRCQGLARRRAHLQPRPPAPSTRNCITQNPAQAATPSPSPTHPLAGEPAVEKVGDGGCREDGRAQRGRGRWGRPKPGWGEDGEGGGGGGGGGQEVRCERCGTGPAAPRRLGPRPPARSHRRPAQARQRRGRA